MLELSFLSLFVHLKSTFVIEKYSAPASVCTGVNYGSVFPIYG